jgi:multimeric flavodoxin WrbA
MRYIRKFNESETKQFKNTDEDIKMFFTDYTDESPDALTITNCLLYDGMVIKETPYMKNISKYRRCKQIELTVGKADGIKAMDTFSGGGQCFTSFEVLKNAVFDIERFFALSNEEVNYTINTSYDELVITFVTVGDDIKPEETHSTKIDTYLLELKGILSGRGYKRISISGNRLDLRTPQKPRDTAINLSWFLSKIKNGERNLDNTNSEYIRDIELIKWRNKIIEDRFNFDISGGDNQVVIKMIKL